MTFRRILFSVVTQDLTGTQELKKNKITPHMLWSLSWPSSKKTHTLMGFSAYRVARASFRFSAWFTISCTRFFNDIVLSHVVGWLLVQNIRELAL